MIGKFKFIVYGVDNTTNVVWEKTAEEAKKYYETKYSVGAREVITNKEYLKRIKVVKRPRKVKPAPDTVPAGDPGPAAPLL